MANEKDQDWQITDTDEGWFYGREIDGALDLYGPFASEREATRALAEMVSGEHTETDEEPRLLRASAISAFLVAPQDQGQLVEVAYASCAECECYVRRTTDRSDRSVSYEWLDFADTDNPDDPHEFEPWNGLVPDGPWGPAIVR